MTEPLAAHQSPQQQCRRFMSTWCKSNDMRPELLIYPCRSRSRAWPRQAFMLAAHKAGHSKASIAEVLCMDRKTVIHGIRAAAKREAA